MCMKNVTLLERQLRNATSAKALTPVFLPDGKSCLFYGNQQLLTVDTVSELIAGLFLTVHNNSQISSILIAFPNGVRITVYLYSFITIRKKRIFLPMVLDCHLYICWKDLRSLPWILSVNLGLVLEKIIIANFF